MTPRKRKKKRTRLYWRERNGVRRAYGDFRDYATQGGKLEALVPQGERLATTDPDLAATLLAERLRHYEEARRAGVILKRKGSTTLSELAARHLELKAKSGTVTKEWVAAVERHLQTAVDYFERGGFRSDLYDDPETARELAPYRPRDVGTITVEDVRGFVSWVRSRYNGRSGDAEFLITQRDGTTRTVTGGVVSGGTARHYLVALSNLYRRAQEDGVVGPGYNPAQALMDKPRANTQEARWLEVHEAALLLESARRHEPSRSDGIACIYPLIATLLLTGARVREVLGLAVDDVSFDNRSIAIRPHPWRRLKTKKSRRVVPLWPQLEAILREYVFGGDAPPKSGGLLFPSQAVADPEKERMIDDLRKALDLIAGRAGWQPGEVRPKMFRHTYCAARLQTLEGGAPVSPFKVGRELGHGGSALVERVYGHVGNVQHRREVVEFLIENHASQIADRLELLAANYTGTAKERTP